MAYQRRGGRGGYDGGRGGYDGGRGGRGGRGGGRGRRMPSDEATWNAEQTKEHLAPVIRKVQEGPMEGDRQAHDTDDVNFAKRPDKPGAVGRVAALVTNFYRASVDNMAGRLFHHDCCVYRTKWVADPEHEDGGKREVDQPGEGLQVKPIPSGTVKEVFMKWVKDYSKPGVPMAHDGMRNIYSPEELVPEDEPEKWFQVDVPSGRKYPHVYQLRMKKVNEIDTTELQMYIEGQIQDYPATVLQALEIILNAPFLRDDKFLYQSRGLYELGQAERAQSVGSGGQCWVGYKQDFRPCQLGLMLAVEPSFSVFYEAGKVPKFCEKVLSPNHRQQWSWPRDGQMKPNEMRMVNNSIKGLMVEGHYSKDRNGKEKTTQFTAKGVSKMGADRYMFSFKPNRDAEPVEISVADHFRDNLRIPLENPSFPCVIGKGRMKGQDIAVPIELMSVKPGQKKTGLLIGEQQAQLVRMAAQKPQDKKADISSWLRKTEGKQKEVEKEFGLSISSTPVEVDGRFLPTPVIEYKQPQHYYSGTTGAWNMKQFKLFNPKTINCYAFVMCMGNDGGHGSVREHGGQAGDLDNFIESMHRDFNDVGLTMPRDHGVVLYTGDLGPYPAPQDLDACVKEVLKKVDAKHHRKPDLVFFVMPRRDPMLYKLIKREMDCGHGIVSQVLIAGKASSLGNQGRQTNRNQLQQYIMNVGLKVNHKLGGQNMRIHGFGELAPEAPAIWSSKPTMLLGIDVTHPQSLDTQEPSIVGIVASMDAAFAQFACRIKQNKYREEIVTDMKDDIIALLKLFRQRNEGVKPESIVIYRDGVSQGEFKKLLLDEYKAVRAAGEELEEGYTPPITFITVQKRHRARFFPKTEAADDGGGNVRPGMCVDQDITLAVGYDFYLNSHKGIQGTVRAGHYHVLLDENNFGADAIQIATYWLCYSFCRCTRSVSKCAPAYYAHLAAERGRNLLDRDSLVEDIASTRSGGSGGSGDRPAPRFYEPSPEIQDAMFFI